MHTNEIGTVAICAVVSVEKLVLLAFATAAVVHHGMKDDTEATLALLYILVCYLTCTCDEGIACHVRP